MNNKEDHKPNDWYVAYGIYGFAGVQLAVSVVVGLIFGNYVDKKVGTTPWLTIVGLILGTTAGFYNLIRLVTWRHNRK